MEMDEILINRDEFFDLDGHYVNKKNFFRQFTSDNEFYDAMNDFFKSTISKSILWRKMYFAPFQ